MIAASWIAAAWVIATAAPPAVEGLDHVPVAVTDLDGAAARFSRLGFVIKPGRPHADGIRNRHVKFPNGGGIELITASAPGDDLARDYVDWLKGGSGPAFWSLYSPDLAGLTKVLADHALDPVNHGDLVNFPQRVMPHRLFFADRLRSPTDGPRYWSHPNTAYRLAGVWIAGDAPELRLLPALGLTPSRHRRCAPFEPHVITWVIPGEWPGEGPGEGDEVLAAPGVHRSAERAVIGMTVLVEHLSAARKVLRDNGVRFTEPGRCGGRSVWIAPEPSTNMWLELRERRRRSGG